VDTYWRILRGADFTHRYWVALEEEKCTRQHFRARRDFCEQRKLSLPRHGHSVVHQGAFYQVFMFAEEEHAVCGLSFHRDVWQVCLGTHHLHCDRLDRVIVLLCWLVLYDCGPRP
jgi:hypothetical protein